MSAPAIPFQIRDGTDDDLPGIARLYGHYVRDTHATFDTEPPTTADWQHALDVEVRNGPHELLVAYADEYDELFDRLQDGPFHRIHAGIALPNEGSARCHRRYGFEHVGTFHEVGHKLGRYWEVAWYEKPLEWTPDLARADPAGT